MTFEEHIIMHSATVLIQDSLVLQFIEMAYFQRLVSFRAQRRLHCSATALTGCMSIKFVGKGIFSQHIIKISSVTSKCQYSHHVALKFE